MSDNYVSIKVCLPCDDGEHSTCYGDECRCPCEGGERLQSPPPPFAEGTIGDAVAKGEIEPPE